MSTRTAFDLLTHPCALALRAVSLAVLAIVVFFGLFVIVSNVGSEAIEALFVGTAVSLSILGFVAAFVSKPAACVNKPFLRLAYAGGILTAIVVQIADGYSWISQRFVFNFGAVIAFHAIILFGVLVMHIRNNRSGYSPMSIFLAALITLAYTLLSFGIFNASRAIDAIEPGIISFLIIMAQAAACVIRFGLRSIPRYFIAFSILTTITIVYVCVGYYLFLQGGGF